MLVRVQHIDGTLEPPVSTDWNPEQEDLLGLPRDADWGARKDLEAIADLEADEDRYEVGTMFGLGDGRLVQVIGYERESDGSIRYLIVGERPETRVYSATGHEAYVHDADEFAMGSPQYGTLILNGSPVDGGAEVEEGSLLWSPDGRYLAATVLASMRFGPPMKVIVIDAELRQIVRSSEARSGRHSPLMFVGRSLFYSPDDAAPIANLAF